MHRKHTNDLVSILWEKALRATPGRIDLLEVIAGAMEPLSVADIEQKLSSKVDLVTVYRTLETFEKFGLVRRVHFPQSVHYEFIREGDHHHHLVCEGCGVVEDVEVAEPANMEKSALIQSKKFNSIASHSLEFFGRCKSCS